MNTRMEVRVMTGADDPLDTQIPGREIQVEPIEEFKTSSGLGWVSSVTIDCRDPAGLAQFWASLLGLDIKPRRGRYVALQRPPAGAPELVFQPVPEPKEQKARIHLDIGVDNLQESTQRVLELGGSTAPEIQSTDDPFQVMRDPEGNEFCLIPSR